MRILIVKSSSFGDIIQSYPVLSYLKERQGVTSIDWVVESPCIDLVERHPLVDNVIPIDTKRWRRLKGLPEAFQTKRRLAGPYDVVFDLQGNVKSGLFTLLTKAKDKVGYGFNTVPEWPNLCTTNIQIDPQKDINICERYLSIVKGYFADEKPYKASSQALRLTTKEEAEVDGIAANWIVCPGSAWKNKRVPIDQLARLLRRFERAKGGSFLFVWGNEEERITGEELRQQIGGQLAPKLTLPKIQSVMRRADGVLAMDSLPLHLCGTTDTPAFGFFGPSQASVYMPTGPGRASFQGCCPYSISFGSRCPKLRSCHSGACITEQKEADMGIALKRWNPRIRSPHKP